MTHLESLSVRRAPGLARPLAIEGLSAGQVVLVGPNASGKSTVGRILRGMLWPSTAPGGVVADATWRVDGEVRGSTMVYGRVEWTGAPLAAPEEAADAWTLSVADLLRSDQATEAPIARAIERALAGGYDLAAARAAFGSGDRPPPAAVAALREALGAARAAQEQADDLAGREQVLQRWIAARDDAAAAARELRVAEKALELTRARREAAAARGAIEALPPELGALAGDEAEAEQEASRSLAAAEAQLARARSDVAEARDRVAALGFPGDAPTAGTLRGLAAQARGLREDEGALDDARTLLAEARARAALAAEQVLAATAHDAPPSGDGPPPTTAQLQALEDALEARQAARARLDAAQRVFDATPRPVEAPDRRRLELVIALLRGWLAAPSSAPVPGPPWLPWALITVGALVAAAAVLVGWLALVAGALLGAGAALLLARRRGRPSAATGRAAIEAEMRRQGLPGPEAWEAETVRAYLARQEGALDDAREAARATSDHERARRDVESARRALEAAEHTAAQQAATAGLAPDLPALTLSRCAQRLVDLDAARVVLAGAEGQVRELTRRCEARLDGLTVRLATLGVAVQRRVAVERPRDDDSAASPAAPGPLGPQTRSVEGAGAAVLATIEELDARLGELDGARRTLAETTREELRLRSQIDALTGRRDALLARGGVTDAEALRERVAQLPAARDARQRSRDAEGVVARLEAELRGSPRAQPVDETVAEAEVARLTGEAEALGARTREVAALEQALRAATEGRSLEDARAAVQGALDTLEAARTAAARDALGRLLADHVAATTARTQAPRLLERARGWVLRFTRGAFALDTDGDGGFVARDTTADEQRRLDELSDATRIQLLLAARLAFLEEAEGSAPPLPLFLDEALSTTDRGRLRAIVRCLLELVDAGRQVIYATADEAEAALWAAVCSEEGRPAPRIVHLTADDGWTGAAAPLPEQTWPDPTAHDATSFTAAAGLGRPRLHDPAASWPIPLVLHDDLDGALRCLRAGLATVGAWRALRANPALPPPVGPPTAARLDARAALLDATLDLLRIGRGRPLRWADVEASGAVTPAFSDEMRRLLVAHAEDPTTYVEAVGALPRFRVANRDRLAEHLRATGHLDDAAPLAPESVLPRAHTLVAPLLASGALTLDETATFVRACAAVIDARSLDVVKCAGSHGAASDPVKYAGRVGREAPCVIPATEAPCAS